jgi:CRP/FNR family transcriptional regulator, cyclic AMP receptor protein
MPYGIDSTSESCPASKYRRSGFFCQLSAAELKHFDALKSVIAYPAKAFIFLEQEKTKGIYVICEGDVKLSISSSEGKTLLLRIAGPGEVLGLFSALSCNSYEVSAETLRPCQVAFVSSGDFRKFLRRHPKMFQLVANDLASQYRSACEKLCAVGTGLSILERVAQFLLTWSADRGAPEDGIQFVLPLNHEEIGECVGTTRESVTRALGEFRSRGLIEGMGATLLIRNRAALEAVRDGLTNPTQEDLRLVRLTPFRRTSRGIRHALSNQSLSKQKSA